MAIALDTTNKGFAFATSLTYSHTCTGSNLILFVNAVVHSDVISSVTYNGVSMTQVTAILSGTSFQESLWYLIGPATGANNIVITSGASTDEISATSASYSGVNQGILDNSSPSGPTGNVQTFSQSLTTVADNCWVVWSGWFPATSGTLPTAGTNTTVRQREANAGGAWWADSNAATTPAGSVTLTVNSTGSSNKYMGIIVSIAPVSPSAIKTINGLAKASVKTVDGLAIASVKTWDGLV